MKVFRVTHQSWDWCEGFQSRPSTRIFAKYEDALEAFNKTKTSLIDEFSAEKNSFIKNGTMWSSETERKLLLSSSTEIEFKIKYSFDLSDEKQLAFYCNIISPNLDVRGDVKQVYKEIEQSIKTHCTQAYDLEVCRLELIEEEVR